jgi:hypothetical protein
VCVHVCVCVCVCVRVATTQKGASENGGGTGQLRRGQRGTRTKGPVVHKGLEYMYTQGHSARDRKRERETERERERERERETCISVSFFIISSCN